MKNAGIEVVYIKATEGTSYKNSYLNRYYTDARANGLKIGFYHFLTATSIAGAEAQAQYFADAIEGKEVDCKLALDYEEFYGVSKNQANRIAVAFIKKIKAITGKDVIVYSNLNNLRNTFDGYTSIQVLLWLAYYGNPDNLLDENYAWDTYIGIQYTSTGRVPGINGNVDRNRFSKEILMDDLIPGNEPTTGDPPNPENGNIINYIVKSGDTLSQIALRYGTTVSEIAKLNNIKNVNLIYPGQILEIITNTNSNQSLSSNTNAETITYTIKRGDTLSQIALNYNVTVQDLVNWNNIQNPNLIYTGNTLTIYTPGIKNQSSQNIEYRVQKGDTLWAISLRYGTTVDKLVQVNNIQNRNLIYPGQILLIY